MDSCCVFYGRARFNAARSLLGLWCLRSIRDERKAEAVYLIIASSTIVAGLVGVMAITSLWEMQTTDAAQFWLWPWAVFGLLVVGCLAGYTPGVRVSVTLDGLEVCQGRRRVDIEFTDIRHCQVVSALAYYRNYALYRDTQRYMARISEDVLVLVVGCEYIAIGLCPAAHAKLSELIHRELMTEPRESQVVDDGV